MHRPIREGVQGGTLEAVVAKPPRMAALRERRGGGVRRAGSGGDHDQDAEASRSLPSERRVGTL
ncbi:hypothetical protein GCM10009787_77860 [Streptomyces bangladeshensis]|uniref:Uncharacterized protein n=1 Tax=Streptomyces bangladeshensis TaxID=295352 RepID=A0ABN1ZKC7_9ACTN